MLRFVVASPVWMVGTEFVRWTLFIAFRRSALRGELDREWLARMNGTALVTVGVASAIIAAVLILPARLGSPTTLASGLASGLLAALMGKSAALPFDPTRVIGFARAYTSLAVALAAAAFGVFLLAFIGSPVLHAAWWAANRMSSPGAPLYGATFCAAALIGAGCLGLALLFGREVDLEAFSMHAVYRNRLVRAFLGSARQDRGTGPGVSAPGTDPYTGFNPADDVRVSETFRERTPPRLFPVINVALNATRMSDSARMERMAVPFTITPTSCGSAALHLPGTRTNPDPSGAYVETAFFDGRGSETGPKDNERGITLGRAMALSGAAVSPNMGYHSSPLVAFVMTLFNVRLGAWLPNPGSRGPWVKDPSAGLRINETLLLFRELLGLSDIDSDFVYLSDGRHFDNLGLYEMLRRRCRYIVVVDAARDEGYGFQDLGLTLRRALIDMNVAVDFAKTIDVGNKTAPMRGGFAKVVYADASSPKAGFILYLKTWMPEAAPIEVRAFKAEKKNFLHESTGNQFFTESDFESYRRLGEHLCDEVIRGVTEGVDGLSLAQLFHLLAKAPAAS